METKIIRTPRKEQYFIVSHILINDKRLSWEARGLLIYLLSKPDDWTVNVKYLIKGSPAGRDKVYRILSELIVYGYIERNIRRNKHGKICGYTYFVYEMPLSPFPENPDTDIPIIVKPLTESQENILTTDTNYVCSSTTEETVKPSVETELTAPSFLSPDNSRRAIKMVSEFPNSRAQEILDELAGIERDGKLRGAPIPCLQGIINKEKKGEFNPARGISIANARLRNSRLKEMQDNYSMDQFQLPNNWENDPLKKKLEEIGKLMSANE